MRILTPTSLRELAGTLREKMPRLTEWANLFDQCAGELESRDSEIEGLKRALDVARNPLLVSTLPMAPSSPANDRCPSCGKFGVHVCVTCNAGGVS